MFWDQEYSGMKLQVEAKYLHLDKVLYKENKFGPKEKRLRMQNLITDIKIISIASPVTICGTSFKSDKGKTSRSFTCPRHPAGTAVISAKNDDVSNIVLYEGQWPDVDIASFQK